MAESYITRKGGGGAAINGLIESYKVKAGENISAGDFVDYINQTTQVINQGDTNAFQSSSTQTISATTLDSSRVLVAYSNYGNARYGTARVLSISGTTITVGTDFIFSSGQTYDISATTLDNGKVLVAYRNYENADYGTARILSISETTISAPSSAFVFQSSYTQNISTTTLDSSKVLVAYRNQGNSGYGTARILSISGTTISAPTSAFVFFNTQAISNTSSVTLDNSKVLVAFRNTNNGRGTARILSISGTTISAPTSAFEFETQNIDYLSATALDNSKVLVAYRDSSANGRGLAKILSISETTISAPSSAFVFQDQSIEYTSVKRLDNSRVLLAYKNSDSNNGTARVLSISGTTITGLSTNFIFSPGNTYNISATALDNSKVLVSYTNDANSAYGTARVISTQVEETLVFPAVDQIFGVAKTAGTGGQTIDVYVDETAGPFKIEEALQNFTVAPGQTITAGTFVDYLLGSLNNLEFGNETVFNSVNTSWFSATALGDDKIVVVFSNNVGQGTGVAVVGTVSSTSVTWGNPSTFNPGGSLFNSVTALSNNKIVIAFRDDSNSSRGTVIIGTISGTSITWGNKAVFNATGTDYSSVVALGIDKVAIFYRTNSNNIGSLMAATISGNSFNFGSASSVSGNTAQNHSILKIDDTKVVVFFESGGGGTGVSRIATISGTSISWGSEVTFNSNGATPNISATILDPNKIVVVYGANRAGNLFGNGYARVGTISGTSISYGVEASFNNTNTLWLASSAFGTDGVVVSYQDTGNSFYGTSKVGTISGTSITFGNAKVFNTGNTTYNYSVVFGTSKIVIAFRDGGNSSYGTAVVGAGPLFITNPTAEKVFGLAKTGGTAGQTIEVFVNE